MHVVEWSLNIFSQGPELPSNEICSQYLDWVTEFYKWCRFFYSYIGRVFEEKIIDFLSIFQLRSRVAKEFEVEEVRVCLIYSGKIMKDEENLSTHNIKNGITMHLVIRVSG